MEVGVDVLLATGSLDPLLAAGSNTTEDAKAKLIFFLQDLIGKWTQSRGVNSLKAFIAALSVSAC